MKLLRFRKLNKIQLFHISLLLIFCLGLFFRFYRFDQRWKIDNDPARDALVAHEALRLHKLPLIGSFSSAGPFVFGPLFYYFNIVSYLIFPKFLIAPWILLTFVDAFLILIMAKIGKIISSERLGIILALLTALSPTQIIRGNSLSQHTFLYLFSALTILNFCLYLKKNKMRYLFWTAISLGCALNFHYQAVTLLIFIPIILFIHKNNAVILAKKVFLLLAGLSIPSFSLIYWDYTQQWKNIRNIFDYFLIGQFRIWVSRRWLTYLGKYWPEFWSEIINYQLIFGYIFMFLFFIITLSLILRRQLDRTVSFLILIFIFQIVLTRYYRGELFKGYLYFYHPFIFLFSALVIDKLYSWKKILGIFFFSLVIFFSFKKDLWLLKYENNNIDKLEAVIKLIQKNNPNKKFKILNYQYYFSSTFPFELSLFLSFKDLIDEKNGLKIGIATTKLNYPALIGYNLYRPEFYLYNLDTVWGVPRILRTYSEKTEA